MSRSFAGNSNSFFRICKSDNCLSEWFSPSLFGNVDSMLTWLKHVNIQSMMTLVCHALYDAHNVNFVEDMCRVERSFSSLTPLHSASFSSTLLHCWKAEWCWLSKLFQIIQKAPRSEVYRQAPLAMWTHLSCEGEGYWGVLGRFWPWWWNHDSTAGPKHSVGGM